MWCNTYPVFARINKLTQLKIILFTVFLIACCQALAAQTSDSGMVWPGPPQRARIRHIRTIDSLMNRKEEKGFFGKVLSFLAGSEKAKEWLVQPVGVAVSPGGIIYITDPGARGVHIIDQKSEKYSFVGETKYGTFQSPVGVACAVGGAVFVTDSELHRIIVADEALEARGSITDHIQRPAGVAVIGGKLYVADAGLHKIVMFDLAGTYLGEFGLRGTGDGEFNYPVQLGGRDTLYVVDALNYRIQKFDPSGKFQSAFGRQGNVTGRFASPKAVALDSDGDLYVTDALMDNFQIFSPAGALLLVVGRRGTGEGEFMNPNGIAIDSQNHIFIVDALNKRVQIFQYMP